MLLSLLDLQHMSQGSADGTDRHQAFGRTFHLLLRPCLAELVSYFVSEKTVHSILVCFMQALHSLIVQQTGGKPAVLCVRSLTPT